MAKQDLDLGVVANDNTGDTLRAGGQKINQNFVEIYSKIDSAGTVNYASIFWTVKGLPAL